MASVSVSSWCVMGSLTELAREEQGCGAWGTWSPWGLCGRTCEPGVQSRSHHCAPPSLLVLQRHRGPEHQTQACSRLPAQWMVNGAPGLPGPYALSPAQAP
ncbi:Sco-Spondin [Manis pentadactyla]|nr:Sco-Spondin [Manis pentadactyla]